MTVKSMSDSQRKRFIRHMEVQGVTVTPTRKGLFLRLPDGSSTVKHFTESDVRAEQNLMSRLRRAGVFHPDDPKGMTEALPKYITEGTVTDGTKRKLLDWVISQGIPDVVFAAKVVHDLKMDPGQVNRALYHSGFRPGAVVKKRAGRPWITPSDILALRETEPDPEFEVNVEPREPERAPVPLPSAVKDAVDRAHKAQQAVNELGAGVPEVKKAPEEVPAPVESVDFIDERDSWVVDPRRFLGESVYQLAEERLALLDVVGIDFEIRVWRTKHD